MKNILLIGGAGYVGSVITSQFLKKGYKITVLVLGITDSTCICFTICLLYFRDFTNNKNAHEKPFWSSGSLLNLEEYNARNGMTVLFSSEIAMWTC